MSYLKGMFVIIVLLCTDSVNSQLLLNGIYCGEQNCYDILGVTRDSSKSDIAKNYRKLAKQYHPDVHRERESKLKAEEQFKIVATAYEILKDDESRSDYDYMLDNPDEYYAHYYRYYRRKMSPKVDVRLVLIVTISVISVIQYYSGWQRYDSAIKYFVTIPKYRNKALEIAKDEGMYDEKKAKGKHKRSKEEVNQIIRKIIEDKMDIKGAYAKPSIKDILWIQLIVLPYTTIIYIYWYCSWIWRHTIVKQPYNKEEKLYIIRKYMKMSQHQFDGQEDVKKQEFLDRELWVKEKFDLWFSEEEENAKKQMAENNRYKQYRRYLKNHGVGRMTFDDS